MFNALAKWLHSDKNKMQIEKLKWVTRKHLSLTGVIFFCFVVVDNMTACMDFGFVWKTKRKFP